MSAPLTLLFCLVFTVFLLGFIEATIRWSKAQQARRRNELFWLVRNLEEKD